MHDKHRIGSAPTLAVIVGAIAAAAAGCRGPASSGTVLPAGADEQVPAWTKESLEIQPQMALLKQRIPAGLGYKPGTTRWTVTTTPLPAVRAENPGKLLTAVTLSERWADGLGEGAWEQTSRIWLDDADPAAAVGVVLEWGLMDDGRAGRDYRVQMRQADGMWQVQRIEERSHCARAVSPAGRCS